VIMTSDRDAFSPDRDTTTVLRIIDGGVESSPMLTPSRLMTMIGVGPTSTGLRGDGGTRRTTWAGVRGIGPKTVGHAAPRTGLGAGGVRRRGGAAASE